MAPSLRHGYLVCFYCNKKSDLRYDGLTTKWKCKRCESVNYLDENGEITDPPVATEQEAHSELQYTIRRSESPLQSPESSFFCPTCLKNQHLYNASISQYHVELDPSHENYRESEKKYYKFRRDLEKRYPQVCKDCEPRVLERMKEAGKTAKADYLRRLMDKSRARRQQSGRHFSLSGSIIIFGRLFWLLGLAGQLSWNVLGLAASMHRDLLQGSEVLDLPTLEKILVFATAITTESPLIRGGFVCSLVSLWWNPMLKEMNRGFMYHIQGVTDWYKLQGILLVARGLFWFVMGSGVLSNPSSPATRGAHMFMLSFVTIVLVKSRRSLRVDMTPLWAATPEKLPNVGPRSQSPGQAGESMADALDQILMTPSKEHRPQTSFSSSLREISPVTSLSPTEYSRSRKPFNSMLHSSRQTPSTIQAGNTQCLSLEDAPSRLVQQQRFTEEMEWSPTQQPVSKYRAFDPARSGQRQNQLFGQAPIAEQPSPFWFKVPPAPITPAQQLRNPPNQPRLRVSSIEAKENFFNNVSRRDAKQDAENSKSNRRHDVDFARPKFFPQPLPSEPGNNLVDLLGSFSLQDEDSPRLPRKDSRIQHVGQGVALALALFFWDQAFKSGYESVPNLRLIVMGVCAAIAIRTALENAMSFNKEKRTGLATGLGACTGGLELAAAFYGVYEIVAGRGDCGNCHSLGTILIGEMLVHEIWRSVME